MSDKTLEAPPLQKALPIRSDSPLALRSRTPGTSQQTCKATRRSSRVQSPVWLAQMRLHGTPPWGDPRPGGEVGVPAHRPAGLMSFLFPAPGAWGKKKMSVTPLPPARPRPPPLVCSRPLRKPRPRWKEAGSWRGRLPAGGSSGQHRQSACRSPSRPPHPSGQRLCVFVFLGRGRGAARSPE